MKFGEVLKEIRLKKNDSFRKLGTKMGIAFTYIDKIEKGLSPVSENFFNKLILVYPEYEDVLTKAYFEELLPERIIENKNSKFFSSEELLKKNKIKSYDCDTKTEGTISKIPKYKEMMVPVEFEFDEKSFCINIIGNNFSIFFDKDILYVERTKNSIQMLNKKIIVVKIENNLVLRKVEIRNYTPYLISLNEVYEPIEYSEKYEIIGIVTKLLYRDLLNINM